MEKIMRIFLCIAILVQFTAGVSAAGKCDIFRGIAAKDYTESQTDKIVQETDGAISITEAGGMVVYRNLEFYKTLTHLEIKYSTQNFVVPRKIEFRLDSPDGPLLAEATLRETVRYTNIVTDTIETVGKAEGIHDLYLIDVNGNAGRIYDFRGIGKWEDAEPSQYDTEYAQKCALLNSLGIADNTIDLEEQNRLISRAEFSAVLCRTFGIVSPPVIKNSFFDLSKDTAFGEYLTEISKRGLLKETGGYIRPGAPVITDEAVYAFLALAGYPAEAIQDGHWMEYAQQAGLLSGVRGMNTYVTCRDMVVMAENALEMHIPRYQFENGAFYSNYQTDKTVLTEIHHINKGEGIITANGNTALSNPEGAVQARCVKIKDKVYAQGKTQAGEYIGYTVRFYVREDDMADVPELIHINKINKLNTILEIPAEDIEWFSEDTLQYIDKKDQARTEKIPSVCDVLYNGISCSNYTEDDFMINEGKVTFIDNDNDGSWEIVTVQAGQVYVAESIDIVNDIIYPKSNNGMLLAQDAALSSICADRNEIRNVEIFLDGIPANIDEILPGCILTVYDGKAVDGAVTNRRIAAGSMKVTGKLTAYSQERECTINNTVYKIAHNCTQSISLGAQYTAHLTDSGKIAWFESNLSRNFRYGYVLRAYISEEDGEERFTVKLLDEDNYIARYFADEKIIIDGEKTTDAKEAYALIRHGEERLLPQVVRYRLNNDNSIRSIDTEFRGDHESVKDMLIKNLKHGVAEYRNTTDYFWQNATIDDNTVLFVVPYSYAEIETQADQYQDQDFYAMKNARQFSGINQYVEGYDGDLVRPMGALVKYKNANNGMAENASMILITQVNETINQDDEPIQEIKGIANGAEVSFILTRYAAEDYGIHLKAGDVWLYQLNPKQEIHWMTMLWTKDNSHQFTQSYDLNKSVLNYGSLYICHGTEITDKNGENIAIRVLGNEVGFSLYGANIMLYDARSGKVSQITAGQIPKNDQIGRKQSVFLYAYSQRCRYVVIVRE